METVPIPEPPASTATTFGLLQRCQSGDQNAVNELFALHYPRLRRVVRLRFPAELRARLDEEDLLHEALVRALRKLDKFQYTGEGTFLAWLARIMENSARDALRAQRTRSRDVRKETPMDDLSPALGVADSAGHSPSARAAGSEAERRIETAMDGLNREDRELLLEHFFIGYEVDQIAQQRGRSPEAIRVAMYRARSRLAKLYGPVK